MRTIPSLYLPALRLRPISELPEGEIVDAVIFLADETEGPDNIGVYLCDELYIYRAADRTWTGEMTSRPLPCNARWWLPEADLTAVPSVCAQRDATVHAIREDRL